MPTVKERALEFVNKNGPIIPVHIAKELKTNILMASAILSELVASKMVLISNTKRGGSPYYYVQGQEFKLQGIADNLSGKEKEAYNLIKEKKVMRDTKSEPWQRVALRAIKDFAVPLNVNFQDQAETFWKWYLLTDEEAKPFIAKLLDSEKIEERIEEKIEPKVEIKAEPKKEFFREEIKLPVQEKIKVQEERIPKPKKEKILKEEPADKFQLQFNDYIYKNKIRVLEQEILRKGREINLVIEVPSPIGKLTFYTKVKNKKSISDSDLSLAYNEGQQKKLPTLFLSNGILNKKAQIYLEKNLKGQLTFRTLN